MTMKDRKTQALCITIASNIMKGKNFKGACIAAIQVDNWSQGKYCDRCLEASGNNDPM